MDKPNILLQYGENKEYMESILSNLKRYAAIGVRKLDLAAFRVGRSETIACGFARSQPRSGAPLVL